MPLVPKGALHLNKIKMLVALAGVFLFSSASGTAFAQCTGHAALTDYARSTFVSAAYGDKPVVSVQVLAQPDCAGVVRQALERLGATERFADDKVGYAVVRLPREKVLDALDVPGIAYASAGEWPYATVMNDAAYVPPAERTVAPVPPIALPTPSVATTLPEGGPYYAAAEAGLTALWMSHPEADGRGVRVGVVDEGFDLLHPEVEVAKDENGNLVPKVADVMPLVSPDESSNWVQFGEPIQTTDGTFTAAGRTWTAPHDGTYRFGIFAKKTLYLGPFRSWEKEQDPRLKSISLSVGVLWDEDGNHVWVDTDGDRSFRNQRALGDYGETHDIDWFGTKVGDDDNRIPFGVKIDRARHAAYLSIAIGGHGAFVAGPLAGNRLTGGLFDGAAPNAQLIDVPRSLFLPALVSAFARRDVDVINVSGGIPGRTQPEGYFPQHLVERLIAAYDKPVTCGCALANALNVEDYTNAEMQRRNRQLLPPYVDEVHYSVEFTDDGFQNLIYAPSASLVTESRYQPFDFRSADGRLRDRKGQISWPYAPLGYTIGANPSPTIPVVTGVLADLISEARREHIRYDGTRLNQAVLIGARQLPGVPTSQMGFGVVDAARAWMQLAKMASGDDPANPMLTSFTVARRDGGKETAVHGFHADLPKAGATLSGELWITRHGGYPSGRRYRLSVRGDDDGTYELRDQAGTFGRDEPVRVRFTATAKGGMHVAFLVLEDAAAGVVMQEIPLAIRAPNVPERTALWTETYRVTIPPRAFDKSYVRFDSGTQAARYVMRIPFLGVHRLVVRLPGYAAINNVAATGTPVDSAHHIGPVQNIEAVATIPRAETAEVFWSNRAAPEYEGPSSPPAPDVPIAATLRVEKFAVAFAPAAGHRIQVTNKQAAIKGQVVFYDARLTRSELAGSGPHALATITRTLPAHLTQWRVRVSSASARAAAGPDAVDVFLLNCTAKAGCAVDQQAPMTWHGATLVLDNPAEGTWRVLIRARQAGQGASAYRICEAELTPAASRVEVSDVKHASGAIWTVPLPPAPRSGDAQYVAFRITGVPFKIVDDAGQESADYHAVIDMVGGLPTTTNNLSHHTYPADILRIAVTPLTPEAP